MAVLKLGEIVAIILSTALMVLLIGIAIIKWRGLKPDAQHSGHAVGMEGVLVDDKRRNSFTSTSSPPDKIVNNRAQKFRERAKTTTIGVPEFRVSQKYKGKNIYKTLQHHPDFAEFEKRNSRRFSEDRTSNTNSIHDEDNAANNIINDIESANFSSSKATSQRDHVIPEEKEDGNLSCNNDDNNQLYLMDAMSGKEDRSTMTITASSSPGVVLCEAV